MSKAPSAASEGGLVQSNLVLPNPDPNRLIPEKNAYNGNREWLHQWLREVQENKEFIRDMEFFVEMSGKLNVPK